MQTISFQQWRKNACGVCPSSVLYNRFKDLLTWRTSIGISCLYIYEQVSWFLKITINLCLLIFLARLHTILFKSWSHHFVLFRSLSTSFRYKHTPLAASIKTEHTLFHKNLKFFGILSNSVCRTVSVINSPLVSRIFSNTRWIL